MIPLTMNCISDTADTVTATGMYGAPAKNVAIQITEDGRASTVYLGPDRARRLRDWLTTALSRVPSEDRPAGPTTEDGDANG